MTESKKMNCLTQSYRLAPILGIKFALIRFAELVIIKNMDLLGLIMGFDFDNTYASYN